MSCYVIMTKIWNAIAFTNYSQSQVGKSDLPEHAADSAHSAAEMSIARGLRGLLVCDPPQPMLYNFKRACSSYESL
jgi:hypothetical protein